jgi:hypothetical protein
MAIVYGANYGAPTLDLNFAKNKSLIDTVTGRNLVTFTRSSTATYVGADGLIKSAVANEARFDHNPTTGESLGLLVEEARTNNALYSEQFDNAGWAIKNQITVTANATTSPNDTVTADKLSATVNNSFSLIGQFITVLGAGSFTASVFAKAGEFSWLLLKQDGGNAPGSTYRSAWFNLSTGVIGTVDNGLTTSMQAFSNGWYRCSISYELTGSGTTSTAPHVASSNGTNIVAGADGSKGIYIWGAQLEAGAFPTSYIPTVASTVTRAADVASITGTNFSSWYNQSAGSFFVDANHKGSSHFNNAVFLKVNNGTTNNQIKIFSVGADPYLYIAYIAAEQAYIDAGSVSVGLPNKYAAGFTVNNFALSVNGATAVTDASGTSPMDMTQLTIGARLSGVGQPNGTIARLSYYPTRLQDFQLQQLTK